MPQKTGFMLSLLFFLTFHNIWLEGTQVEVVSDLPRSEYTYEDVEGEAPNRQTLKGGGGVFRRCHGATATCP